MADYGSSLYGWGIDWLMVCSAFSKNLYVAVDEGVTVNHSPTTGYDEKRALAEMQQFLLQFSVFEMINYRLLVAYGASQRSISKNNR